MNHLYNPCLKQLSSFKYYFVCSGVSYAHPCPSVNRFAHSFNLQLVRFPNSSASRLWNLTSLRRDVAYLYIDVYCSPQMLTEHGISCIVLQLCQSPIFWPGSCCWVRKVTNKVTKEVVRVKEPKCFASHKIF